MKTIEIPKKHETLNNIAWNIRAAFPPSEEMLPLDNLNRKSGRFLVFDDQNIWYIKFTPMPIGWKRQISESEKRYLQDLK